MKDTTARNLPEFAPFQQVMDGRRAQVQEYLASGGKVDTTDPCGYTPLMYAVTYMRKQIRIDLVKAGANPNHMARDGQTPLNLAVESGSMSAVQELLQAGAQVNGKGRFVPLQSALSLGHSGIVRLLLSSGADPNQKGTSPNSLLPLEAATDLASVPLTRDLVKAGVDLNARSPLGDTALMQATIMTSPPIIQALVSAGADATPSNRLGRTAEDYAAESGSPAVAHAVKPGSETNKPKKTP